MTLQYSGLGFQGGVVPGFGSLPEGCVEIYGQEDAGKGAGLTLEEPGCRCILPDPGGCPSGVLFEEGYSVFRDLQNSEEQQRLERPA